MAKAIIWLNVLLYSCVVATGAYDLYRLSFGSALTGEFEAVRTDALGIRLVIVVPSLVCIFGVVFRARWGRRAAVSWNFVLAFFLGVMPFIALAFAAYLAGGSVSSFLPEPSFLLTSLLPAVAFLALAIGLRSSAVRALFGAHA
jgi:hypothetical protein